ncbi:LysM domain-containing protein [Candidatus Villigracilis saccharophilus]|uniref:LysM domain-containing protein n=1 Tax=Candidatus Villigracilis saccharophilus TaxID=3140684 RepID=UPI003135D882|nr:LysM peptidoglycan-binding domain-containing protein [Anaerolineales bacterium]
MERLLQFQQGQCSRRKREHGSGWKGQHPWYPYKCWSCCFNSRGSSHYAKRPDQYASACCKTCHLHSPVWRIPYCSARRFNVDPDALLSASGLTSPDVYVPNQKLTIPQSGSFPGSRSLAAHPTTYTVASSSETLYGIACKFGDVDPAAIASANSLAVSATLTAGQKLQIP